ncbi:reverse transcriptase domain-containing protein [Tanacetum coccineum]|uniref:Reverse transcriptase domain-containing protein n=1 Tax=Tanacetum coccineum TaxID=301880 RepID=A0ABQ5B906_9ASTR
MMADQRTMAERLRAPTESYAEAIVVPPISAEHFELKHSLINLVTSKQFFGFEKEDPHAHIRYFNKITSMLKYKDVPESSIKLMLFPFSIDSPARIWLDKEPPRSILTWDNLDRFKDLLRACPHHGFAELHQLDTFYSGLTPSDQDSLNSAAGGNLLERSTQESNIDSSEIASAVASAVTSAMTAMLKQHQVTPTPASVKVGEESCVTCGGAHSYRQCPATDGNTFSGYHDNIQGYVSAAAANYNHGNTGYRPQSVANQIRPPGFAQPNVQNNQKWYNQGYTQERGNYQGNTSYQVPIQTTQIATSSELEKIKKMNEINLKAMQTQINNVKNNNTVANPKGELKAISTRIGLVLDGPSVPMPPPFINPEEDERVEETLTDPEHGEFTIKVPPPLVQKAKPPSQRNFVIHQRDPRHPHIPYPSRMNQEKQKVKDEVQVHKFWQMFKLHINISLADALILIPKYQKMLKALLSNKEKLLELANTPLNENCSAVILKKLPEKLGDPGKFLIPCDFSKLKCKSLTNLGASINLMPLLVWRKLGLPELISTQMTLELANREICILVEIARDVFVPVRKFTFPADFVIVDYESDPRIPLILGRPFLQTSRALIDVYGEEMILCDGDEGLTLNMRNDTSSYSNQPHKESINLIDIYNISYEEYLEDLFANEKITNHLSGNPTFFSHTDLTSPEEEFEAYLASDSFPPGNDDPIDLLPEEFTDELALITFPSGNDDMTLEDVIREREYLHNQSSLADYSLDNDLVDTIPEMFTDEHTLDYLSPPRYDDEPTLDISSPPLWDDFNYDIFDLEIVNDDTYDDPFDSKEDKIKESKLLIDELDPPRSSDLLDQDKVFNPGILIHENLFKDTICESPDKNVKKATNASLILKDFNPPLYELPFHKEVPGLGALLSFSSKNEETVFNPEILISKRVHTSLLPELSHRDPKAFKPGHLAAGLGCAETKVAAWDDLAFKLIILGWNVKHCKNVDPWLKFKMAHSPNT